MYMYDTTECLCARAVAQTQFGRLVMPYQPPWLGLGLDTFAAIT